MTFEGDLHANCRAIPDGREGVPRSQGGDGPAGGQNQRPVLHGQLVADPLHLRLYISGIIDFLT